MLDIPVLLIIFNRPQTTRRVLEAIRQVKPRQLFVAADGPRADQPDDEEKCKLTRAVIDEVDWQCDLHLNYADVNAGYNSRLVTGITWFLEQAEQGIILEDDCVSHPTFFLFCKEMLNYYRMNERIMHISGGNYQFGRKRGHASYYFSIYPICWGWATWRRAWEKTDWKRVTDVEGHLVKEFEWDFYWWKTMKWNNGLAVSPNVNLVSNIGYGEDATHTKEDNHIMNVPAQLMEFPLIHPALFEPDAQADQYTYYTYFRRAKTPLHRTYIQMQDMLSEGIQRTRRVIQRISHGA